MEEADYLFHFLHKSLYLNYNKKKIRRSKFCFLVFIRSQYISAHSERPRFTVHLNVFNLLAPVFILILAHSVCKM